MRKSRLSRVTAQPGQSRSTRSIARPATPRISRRCWRRASSSGRSCCRRRRRAGRSIARCATALPSHSRWCRPPSSWRPTTAGSARRASPSAASPTSRGDRPKPKPRSHAPRSRGRPSTPPGSPRSGTRAAMATTISRFHSPAARCAPRWPTRLGSPEGEAAVADTKLAGPIGRPLDRVDGRLKVTGKATYAFEYAAQGAAAYGFIVPAAIGKGRVLAVDASGAKNSPGVLLVLTKDNAPPQTPWGPVDLPDRFARAEPALNTDEVLYFGFPVAFVVADTFEHATAAGALVRVAYGLLPGEYGLHAAAPRAEKPAGLIDGGLPADNAVGDFESAFAGAPVRIAAIYTTPYQNHAPMEPHATMAEWNGAKLTVHTAAQLTTSPQEGLARTFNIPKENVRVVTRYVGGGFGGKLPYYVDATLAALGARMLGRPVKVAMTRPQVFQLTTHRSASEQHLRLGADRNGQLVAYGQDALVQSARFDIYTEPVCAAARMLYAAPNRLTRHRRAKLDIPRSDSMRAPGEAIGLLGLECAMDELADMLVLNPVELRLRNDTPIYP